MLDFGLFFLGVVIGVAACTLHDRKYTRSVAELRRREMLNTAVEYGSSSTAAHYCQEAEKLWAELRAQEPKVVQFKLHNGGRK